MPFILDNGDIHRMHHPLSEEARRKRALRSLLESHALHDSRFDIRAAANAIVMPAGAILVQLQRWKRKGEAVYTQEKGWRLSDARA